MVAPRYLLYDSLKTACVLMIVKLQKADKYDSNIDGTTKSISLQLALARLNTVIVETNKLLLKLVSKPDRHLYWYPC